MEGIRHGVRYGHMLCLLIKCPLVMAAIDLCKMLALDRGVHEMSILMMELRKGRVAFFYE